MNNTKHFETIDGETLMTTPIEPINFVVDTLLSQGLHILAGASKVGKSWLALWLSVTVAKEDWAINLQIKQNVVHKIRPGVWYSTQRVRFPMFTCLEDFVSAIEQTVWQNPKTRETSGTWKRRFLESYQNHYGVSLNIPRWDDIADRYRNG